MAEPNQSSIKPSDTPEVTGELSTQEAQEQSFSRSAKIEMWIKE